LPPTGLIQRYSLYAEWVLEVCNVGVVESDVTIFANSEHAQSDRTLAKEYLVPAALHSGIKCAAVEIVHLARMHNFHKMGIHPVAQTSPMGLR
jgi:hypothetical protein